MVLHAGPSHFTPELVDPVTSSTVFAKPFHLCTDVLNKEELSGKIAIIERGECTFVDKARRAMNAGASGVIIFDNVADTSINNQPPFAMSGDGKDDVRIPTCFLFAVEANSLKDALKSKNDLEVILLHIEIIKTLTINQFIADNFNVAEWCEIERNDDK
jgi:ER degradation enhancer, mannosidase alpha-like 3